MDTQPSLDPPEDDLNLDNLETMQDASMDVCTSPQAPDGANQVIGASDAKILRCDLEILTGLSSTKKIYVSSASPNVPTRAPVSSPPDDDDDDMMSMYASEEESTPQTTCIPIVNEGIDKGHQVKKVNSSPDDVLGSVDHLYRILELITEQGSGGLVDKIIIAQDSLKNLINTVRPNAYASLTKVNFKSLDSVTALPVGIYGPQESIISFLITIGFLDEMKAQEILSSDERSSRRLQSGIYVALTPGQNDGSTKMYIIYWPEKTTWDDDAVHSVRRNRVTFMRYLSKICDQIICLLHDHEDKGIVWNDFADDSDDNMDVDENIDRFFSFEVSKTLEQDENVVTRRGFNTILPSLSIPLPADDNKSSPAPRLTTGESTQGYMTTKNIQAVPQIKHYHSYNIQSHLLLKKMLEKPVIRVEDSFTDDMLTTLIADGLQDRFPHQCREWTSSKSNLDDDLEIQRSTTLKQAMDELDRNEGSMKHVFRNEYLRRLRETFPRCDFSTLAEEKTEPLHEMDIDAPRTDVAQTSAIASDTLPETECALEDPFKTLGAIYPQINIEFNKSFDKLIRDDHITMSTEYRRLRKQLISLEVCLEDSTNLTEAERVDLAKDIFSSSSGDKEDAEVTPSKNDHGLGSGLADSVKKAWSSVVGSKTTGPTSASQNKVIQMRVKKIRDSDFLKFSQSETYCALAETTISTILAIAAKDLLAAVDKDLDKSVASARKVKQERCRNQVDLHVSRERQEKYTVLRSSIIQELGLVSGTGNAENETLYLTSLTSDKSYAGSVSFKLSGHSEYLSKPLHEYFIHEMILTSDDRQNLQLDAKFIPTPKVNKRFSTSFRLPTDNTILHSQLLPDSRILLMVDDAKEISIYLDKLSNISHTVASKRARKVIHHEKIGDDILLAFDESKRLLAIFAIDKFMLHVFSFDQNFGVLQTWAQPISLGQWYSPCQKIAYICFVTGNEELLLVDDSGQARIFSLVTQQCRPATLELHHRPCAVLPSPDGACFVAVFNQDAGRAVRAYHWATFGSTDGISLDIDIQPDDHFALTSFVNKASVHFITVDKDLGHCRSTALDITKKATEFMFQEKSSRKADISKQTITRHNCLLDCHAEVWTRFPVVPAVQRSSGMINARCPPTLTFVTKNDADKHRFAPYFSELIKNFEQKTRKPTGSLLRSIVVSTVLNTDFGSSYMNTLDANHISAHQLGDWIVGLLCLIPIHIAVTRENRFIPLKDGVTSAEYEKSLLGAEVSSVVDSISFGWYESILQTYMSNKPVKVVSSMGEQSVGKSYALNHLADTSFAGSAMRTTEGVWMSITPTDDILLVSLDFEGVHSIERSAQEDTLLVLFNTAISNLVLFRNNFALSRDITGLFQSFQSSSSVFDPAANPTLFRSTLVIIIKDVGDPDKKEIVREFSLKFQKIVQEEQESNFISRLHAGQLKIIPWPVIESKQFYSLFPTIKTCLDGQAVTHATAGHFLHTLKTIMAKLKANDWRALSQSMAAHRTSQLLAILPSALSHGSADPGAYLEPLKDLDTDEAIDFSDSSSVFFLSGTDSQPGNREARLKDLCHSWPSYHARSQMAESDWLDGLSEHLMQLVNLRIEYVRAWLHKNLEKFQDGTSQISTQTSITALYRFFDATVLDLKANADICKQQCISCQLSCILSRRHDDKTHDCLTSHTCPHQCEFDEDHPDEIKGCGYPAGHNGKHICVVDAHLCGEPCVLQDKTGCLGECTQVAGHQGEEHMCSANVHYCGKPCQLSVKTATRELYSCESTCTIPSDQPHERHICDNRNCPFKCALCSRLCASNDHLHGMDGDAVHLCGETHSCLALCTAKGICEIDTTPQSIEATFTGRHQTFQYTKYSQVAKRLSCVIPIPSMELTHDGQHCHTNESKAFHFCETRCGQCGYYCTLPLGHSQKEHETSHGSMSKARWALENQNSVIELNGRKFGLNDEGAPMMCNLVCQDMGRHVHIEPCRADSAANCNAQDTQHITTRMHPNPSQPKDWVTHELYWKRLGFKDPYSRDDKSVFAKCDAMCAGPEHTTSNPVQPSYCTLPMFHLPQAITSLGSNLGYISNDGHQFTCKNPAVLQQAFHVIFVIDRSGSMGHNDRRPLPGTPVTAKIARSSDNRLGAVYSSLYAFWASRMSAVNGGGSAQSANNRKDSYSVILFDHEVVKCLNNDFIRTPEQLVDVLLPYKANGGTNYDIALNAAQEVMRKSWATERSPIVIFLSDGECSVSDSVMQTFCRSAVALGKPVSFHGVSFGHNNGSLRRMVQIAIEIQNGVRKDPLQPSAAIVQSSFAEALDSVRLAETFLGIAESLKKPRGSLFQG